MAADGDKKRVVVWFRNDLRLHDNACLRRAAELARAQKMPVIPCFIFDPATVKKGAVQKLGPFRAKFVLESLVELKQSLQKVKSDLFVACGRPKDVFAKLPPRSVVLTQEEVTSEELQCDASVKASLPAGARLETLWGPSLLHKDDLPFGPEKVPNGFTPFKEKCKHVKIRPLLPDVAIGELPLPPAPLAGLEARAPQWRDFGPDAPKEPENEPRGVFQGGFVGGEKAALDRLDHYLWKTDAVAKYFDTRNGMLGADYSTKFSAWLSLGCLSPRKIYHELQKYEQQRYANKSTYWVIFELMWRDFFRFFAAKHGTRIFMQDGVYPTGQPWRNDPHAIKAWKEGRTGVPLVDANMRELLKTGFMSNRGRQNVASFLICDLGIDWRVGARHFEEYLIDSDVTSNWGNWVAAAGLTGGRMNRFNIFKQSKDYDCDGRYVKHWCPELAKLPPSKVHEPWKLGSQEQVQLGCADYPQKIQTLAYSEPKGGDKGKGKGKGAGKGKARRVN